MAEMDKAVTDGAGAIAAGPGDDAALDLFFAAGKTAAPEPSAAFLARILADAATVQAGFAAPLPQRRAPRRAGMFRDALAALGGWSVVSGLASATLAGVWIGFAAPAPLEALSSVLLGETTTDDTAATLDLMPGYDEFLAEG